VLFFVIGARVEDTTVSGSISMSYKTHKMSEMVKFVTADLVICALAPVMGGMPR
jgi:hypothetical protein